jgi:hypothetical protein
MNMSSPRQDLHSLIGISQSSWMMHPSERLLLLGLISILKPRRVLEFGCAQGGLTVWLSRLVPEVVTVDRDVSVNAVCAGLPNVTPLCMATDEAAAQFIRANDEFDLTIIDADHSTEGVRKDVINALTFSEVILVHDTFHPPCRKGIEEALAGKQIYSDLELVSGGLQPDGLWGGIGIILPKVAAQGSLCTPRYSTYSELERQSRFEHLPNQRRSRSEQLRSVLRTFRRSRPNAI